MIRLESTFTLEKGMNYSFINPFSLGEVAQGLSEPECQAIQFYADGISVVLFAKLFKKKRIERTSFDDTSIAPRVFSDAVSRNETVALVGGASGNAQDAASLLTEKYPGLSVVYTCPGYFDTDEERQHCLAAAAMADVVIVGMGAVKQERFLLDLRRIGWQGTGFTCGGYLDQLVHAKGKDYYPVWVDRLNLRWLYRLLKEPKRLMKRYFVVYPRYLIQYGHMLE